MLKIIDINNWYIDNAMLIFSDVKFIYEYETSPNSFALYWLTCTNCEWYIFFSIVKINMLNKDSLSLN